MSLHQPIAELADRARIVAPPSADMFDLPRMIHAAYIGCFVAFLTITGGVFMTGELILPFAVFFIYLAMFFGIPLLMARMVPGPATPTRWHQFRERGIVLETGPCAADAAIWQVLTVPVLIVFWGIAVAVIVAAVR